MGNGLIDHISDIIYLKPEDFDNMATDKMAAEIAEMNEAMIKEGRQYILIGPGRWGTRDKYIGIPVAWPQISNAKVIVEVSLPDFHIDASLGSHFFHNVTSMNVGYLSVDQEFKEGTIFWNNILNSNPASRGKYFSHVRYDKPLTVMMDGKKGMAVISLNK